MMHCCTLQFILFIFSSFKYIAQNGSLFLKNDREEEPLLKLGPSASFAFKEEVEVSYEDVNIVMKRLGMIIGSKCQNRNLIEEANVLLEEKVASVEELKEAFEVFDIDRDGFITPNKLWVLMENLGLSEDMRYEDCQRMIKVYDMDGDGRISFHEFKCMMENAE